METLCIVFEKLTLKPIYLRTIWLSSLIFLLKYILSLNRNAAYIDVLLLYE